MVELIICKGPDDSNCKKCKHEWGYEVEEGGVDNKAYPVCVKCGLVCRMSIPVECVPKDNMKWKPDKPQIMTIEESLRKSDEENRKKTYIYASDFKSPREKKCPCSEEV